MNNVTFPPTPDTYRAILDQVGDGVYVLGDDNRIVYWNTTCEALTGYAAEEALGRRCSDELLMHVDSAGRRLCFESCPMAATRSGKIQRRAEVYVHHKSGHRIPVRAHIRPVCTNSGEVVAVVQSFVDITDKVAALEQAKRLEDLAYLDSLTGLPNRRFLERTLEARLNEAARYGWVLGTVMMDIDHF